ncbi:MAG: hypothetical protein QFB87_00035 [Patescibacteria group bacterium]|nr:hypothetical protein [Patescibacteria group bacterium]
MKNIRSRPFWLTIGLIITDALFFGLTNPVKVASILLIAGFALVLLTMYWLLYNLQRLSALYVPWLAGQKQLSLTVVIGLGVLLALQSVGQLTSRDSLLITLAASVLYAYSVYGKRSASP